MQSFPSRVRLQVRTRQSSVTMVAPNYRDIRQDREAIKHNSKLVAEGVKAVPCVCCRRAFARNSRLNGLPLRGSRKHIVKGVVVIVVSTSLEPGSGYLC
ncbi:hypothetical protein pipiens_002537 [Culex pipiens pipiens]|uniref:Uncharacterized protein n=1 Tax=Culex pipiens pipiens TaxID=38569 RepID=A0ABD1DCF1_CULPP